MNSRERFLATMSYGRPDRIPRFQEGIRDEVRLVWESQGLPQGVDLDFYFDYDLREEIEVNLDPQPEPNSWPAALHELDAFKRRFQVLATRFPAGRVEQLESWRNRTIPLILRVQRGFFLSLGVEHWERFQAAVLLTKDQPELVAALLSVQGELSARLVDRLLSQVSVDAALFSEPIGGEHGPLISPQMYETLVLPGYRPILDVLQQHKVPNIIVRTYANPRPLLEQLVQAGINCLWAVEAPLEEMDYLQIRRDFGPSLRLIGGIDTDALRMGREAIRQAVERVVPLVNEGGYIPLLDGRVRDEVCYEDYCFYRELLAKAIP